MDQVRGVIFDCDGVLFESRQANLAYYNRILEAFDYAPVTESEQERVHLCHTASSPDVLANLMLEEHVQPALAFSMQLDYREFIPFMTPEPSLTEMLVVLSQHYPLAVATNRGRSIQPILEHFELKHFFSVIINRCDVTRPKPDPDMLLLAARRLKLPPKDCLFIGDSELDQLAAKSAGITFVGYGGAVEGEYSFSDHRQLLQLFSKQSAS
ncbi:MAG TPA: HAD family hydrolase [Geopsychrobacteraceae bacterium]|nr:HAD family hydrolase [Geopsychrobacteraceae bacterium]